MNPKWRIDCTDVMDGLAKLPDSSVHCVVTSPPYWNLRDYQVAGQIGLEKSPDEYLAKMVDVFREVRRVMRSDATLWLNIGDTYNAYNHNRGPANGLNKNNHEIQPAADRGLMSADLKPKDLCGIPWRLALALQADGWWLRSEIIWAKRSPMPESVTDRPTKAHEQIFLLTRSVKYFYDAFASAEESADPIGSEARYKSKFTNATNGHVVCPGDVEGRRTTPSGMREFTGTRNMRTVWTLSTEPFSEAHFATFPTELVRRCLLAGTSERGCCPTCGAPWRRVVDKQRRATRPGENTKVSIPGGWAVGEKDHSAIGYARADENGKKSRPRRYLDSEIVGNRDPGRHVSETTTTGWQPSCECDGEPIPCLVLDPFSGAGTTVLVARRMQLRAIGIELSPAYAEMSRKRILEDAPLLNQITH